MPDSVQKRGRQRSSGRPEFQPTKAQRRKVAIAAGGGMPHEAIALALGIAKGTLYKHFADELTVGAYMKRLEVLEAMHKAAKRGSVAAQKAYAALNPEVTAPAKPEAPEASAPKPAPMGKKEAAQLDAVTAQVGTEWNDLLPGPKAPPTVQ